MGDSFHQPWPFAQWGIDNVGVLPRAPGNKKYLLAATKYFSKWVKVEPLAQIKEMNVIKFIRRNILSRFGIPKAFISNNGSQFVGQKMKNMLDELKIEFYKVNLVNLGFRNNLNMVICHETKVDKV